MNQNEHECPNEYEWDRFLDGFVSKVEFDKLDAHRRNCDSCQELIDALVLTPSEKPREMPPYHGDEISLDNAKQRLLDCKSEPLPSIPDYTIEEKIGEGGMGVVYKAVEHSTTRTVAIKVISAHKFSRRSITRFRREILTLASVSHANIAELFDSGMLDDGRLFLVMEFIEGKELFEFCQENHLSIKQRLRLVIEICYGIHEAHLQGIIHRDLKPSNVLVKLTDKDSKDNGFPKIIDFGLSKTLKSEAEANSVQTRQGEILGTLQYMSPEQTQSVLELDEKTDVYALGATCYLLLTGKLPIPPNALNLEETLRSIRETVPARPSLVVKSDVTDKSKAVCSALGLTASQLGAQLSGGLDWVVLKALEKVPERRYESAKEFARDIERFLTDEPVIAKPASQIYKARMFYRRNSLLCWIGGGVYILLTVCLIIAYTAFVLAKENTRVAKTAAAQEHDSKMLEQSLRKAAEQSREKAVSSAQSLEEAIEIIGAALDVVNPKFVKVDKENAVPSLIRSIGSNLGQANLGDEDAVIQLRMKSANVLIDMGELDTATPILEGIIQTCKKKYGEHHENTDLARINLGRVHMRKNRLQKAQDIFWEIFQRAKKSRGQNDYLTLAAANYIAGTQKVGGHYPEAIFMLEQVINRYEPDGTDHDALPADAKSQLGEIYFSQKKYAQAEKAFQEAIGEFQRSVGYSNEHPVVLDVRSHLLHVLEKQKKFDEAILLRRNLLNLAAKQYPQNSEPVARAKFNLAILLSNANQHSEAIELLQEVATKNLAGDISLRSRFATVQILRKQNNTDEARTLLQALIPEIKDQLGGDHPLLASAEKLLGQISVRDKNR